MAHGDYHLGNLLRRDDGGLVVVDWEFLAPAPRGTDVLRLWSTLPGADARAAVLAAALDGLGPDERHRLGVLGRWLALRALAEAAGEPERADRRADLPRARAVLADCALLPV